MNHARYADAASWFSTPAGRRYFLRLALLVAVKLALLILLYFVLIAPQPRANLSPAGLQQHLLDTATTAASGGSP